MGKELFGAKHTMNDDFHARPLSAAWLFLAN